MGKTSFISIRLALVRWRNKQIKIIFWNSSKGMLKPPFHSSLGTPSLCLLVFCYPLLHLLLVLNFPFLSREVTDGKRSSLTLFSILPHTSFFVFVLLFCYFATPFPTVHVHSSWSFNIMFIYLHTFLLSTIVVLNLVFMFLIISSNVLCCSLLDQP